MNEFDELSAEINAMREEIRNLEAESRNLERSIEERQNEINDLENERESELLSGELESMRNQAQTLENDIKSIENMVANKENEVAGLENRKTSDNKEGMVTMEENNVNSAGNFRTADAELEAFRQAIRNIMNGESKNNESPVSEEDAELEAFRQAIRNIMNDNSKNINANSANDKEKSSELKTPQKTNVKFEKGSPIDVLEAIDKSTRYFDNKIADKKQRIVVSEDMAQGVNAQQVDSGMSEDKSAILRKLINSGKFVVNGKLDVKELAFIAGVTENQVLLEQDFINAKSDLNRYEQELDTLEEQQRKFIDAKEAFKVELQRQRRIYDRRVEMRKIQESMASKGNTSQDLIDSLNKDIRLDPDVVINKVKKSLITLVNTFPEHVRKDAIKYTQMILDKEKGAELVESLLSSRIADKNDVSNMNLDTLNQKREELLNEKESIKAEINERLNNDDVDPALNDKFKDVVSKLKEVDEFIKKQQKGSLEPEPQLSSNEVVSNLSNALSEKEVEVILNLNSNGKKEVLEGMAEDRGVTLDELVRAAGKKKASIDLGKGDPEHTHENDNNKKYKHYASIVDEFNNNADIPAVSFVDKVRAKEKEEVKRLKDKRRSLFKGMFTLDSAKRERVKSIRNVLKERINKERELANSISSEMISVDYAQNSGVNQEPVVENENGVDDVSINDFAEFNDISEEDLKKEFGSSVKNR